MSEQSSSKWINNFFFKVKYTRIKDLGRFWKVLISFDYVLFYVFQNHIFSCLILIFDSLKIIFFTIKNQSKYHKYCFKNIMVNIFYYFKSGFLLPVSIFFPILFRYETTLLYSHAFYNWLTSLSVYKHFVHCCRSEARGYYATRTYSDDTGLKIKNKPTTK